MTKLFQKKTAPSDSNPVTDDEIQEIIRQNEAGVGEMMETYIRLEEHYFATAARSSASAPVVYSNNTSGE